MGKVNRGRGYAAIVAGTIDGAPIGSTTPAAVNSVKTVVTHSASENVTAISMYGSEHIVIGAYTETLPAAVVGMWAPFRATTAAVMTLDCQAADSFILGGTTLTAGNKIATDGSLGVEFEVICLVANRWTVRNITGTVIDGGA